MLSSQLGNVSCQILNLAMSHEIISFQDFNHNLYVIFMSIFCFLLQKFAGHRHVLRAHRPGRLLGWLAGFRRVGRRLRINLDLVRDKLLSQKFGFSVKTDKLSAYV
jgi:hypothetical protein